MKYEVTAEMSGFLRIIVEAPDQDEAIRMAKEMAYNGQMEEVVNSGDIRDWEAREVTTPNR